MTRLALWVAAMTIACHGTRDTHCASTKNNQLFT